MSFKIKTYLDIFNELKDFIIQRTQKQFPFLPGDIITALAEAFSFQASDIYIQMVNVLSSFSIDKASGEELTFRALDYGISRRKATRATGEVRFYIDSSVVDNNGILQVDILIPEGTIVEVPATTFQDAIKYRTIERAEVQSGSSVLNDGNGYYIAILVECLKEGKVGNIPPNKITTLVGSIPYIVSVNNPFSITGGLDEETDEELRLRIKRYWVSLEKGTVRSVIAGISQVVMPDGRRPISVDLVEDFFTGTVKVYIDDGSGTLHLQTSQEQFTHTISENGLIYLKLPHIAIVSGQVQVKVNNTTLPENPNPDPNEPTQGFWVDYPKGIIIFKFPLNQGDVVQVNYTRYTGLIEKCQQVAFEYKPAGVMTFVLPAQVIFIDLQMVITVITSELVRSIDEVRADIEQEVIKYFQSLKVGEDVYSSQIISRVSSVNEVYSVSLRMKKSTDNTYQLIDKITINQGYLARLGNLSISFEFVEVI